MRVVVALGGNALLRRGEPLTAAAQQANVEIAAAALAPLARQHQLLITHGNGPQVGMLALQGAALNPQTSWPLDVLDAQTEGMIGYLIEQELANHLAGEPDLATVLSRIEVDLNDPAFSHPDKPIGPVYTEPQAQQCERRDGWKLVADGEGYRRVVASPQPREILGLNVIKLLLDQGVLVICAGGGGIPVVRDGRGKLRGVEAVIDKDAASALLAEQLDADALLMLTDVDAVYQDWAGAREQPIHSATPTALEELRFEAGTMAPKIAAACRFSANGKGFAAIGRLQDAPAIFNGDTGTRISGAVTGINYRDCP